MNIFKNDAFGKTLHLYANDNDFTYNYTVYEKDEYNGRCYILEESKCMRYDCDGKLVRKRISKDNYEKALKKCKEELGIDDETKGIRNGNENNMKKKDLETENKYLKLQLDIIYDLLKNSYKYDEIQLYETIGVIRHCSNKETYEENMKFIKENELPYDFFER